MRFCIVFISRFGVYRRKSFFVKGWKFRKIDEAVYMKILGRFLPSTNGRKGTSTYGDVAFFR